MTTDDHRCHQHKAKHTLTCCAARGESAVVGDASGAVRLGSLPKTAEDH